LVGGAAVERPTSSIPLSSHNHRSNRGGKNESLISGQSQLPRSDMTKSLAAIAQKLMEPGKGILAADESEGTIAKRFAKINLPNSLDLRRDYREMLFRSTEAMTRYISGVIL